MSSTQMIIAVVLGTVVLVGALGYVALTGGDKPETEMDKFAKCLSENGATMYGLQTCPHCQEQKGMFGSSFKFVSYVECSQRRSLCSQKGISSVPTWIVNGERYVGVQSLGKLADITGCEPPA
ncbi:MAG: glutaredoxin family protein [Candidatus Aenigmatarchaeota archaeon]